MCSLLLHIILVIFVYKKQSIILYFKTLKKYCVYKNGKKLLMKTGVFFLGKKFKFYLLQIS